VPGVILGADWAALTQQVVGGLSSGGVYAMLALALVLIYRSTGVVNFAQGEMAMFSTFVAWTLVDHGVGYWGAVAVTILVAFVGGIGIERVVIRPVERAPELTIAIVTLGLFFLLNGAAFWLWSPEQKYLRSTFSTRPVDVAGVQIAIHDLGVIAVAIVASLLLAGFFRYTKPGLTMRAVVANAESSRLLGVRVGWMLALGWGLAAALGAVAGLLTAAPSFDQSFMQPVLLYAFAGAVLGGIDSALGAVVGSFLLGIFLNLITSLDTLGIDWSISNDLRLPTALAVILLVLLVRPSGLFGRARVRRV
jgi:branched-chain amino acid transport system permease protein